MWNSRRLFTAWSAAVLALGVRVARADEQLVTLKYVGTDVRKAISMLQTVSDLRVAIDPRVPSKRITLSLKDVPPEDALRTVVASAGLTCRKVGNAFLVEPKRPEKPQAERLHAGERDQVLEEAQSRAAGGFGGIVRPDAPAAPPAGSPALLAGRQAPVEVSPEVLAALEHPVDVDVKNGALSAVTEQLSRSSGIKVSADPALAAGLVASVGLHGIPLKAALELVAGQTGLQLSPRPDGVAFVPPGLSLDQAQARGRSAPPNATHVDQGQLWTAEWAKSLTSGISSAKSIPATRSLRRQPVNPDGRPFEFKPRSGGMRQSSPAQVAPAPPSTTPAPATPALQQGAGNKADQRAKSQKTQSASHTNAKTSKQHKGKRTAQRTPPE
jgi:hypothetical protein